VRVRRLVLLLSMLALVITPLAAALAFTDDSFMVPIGYTGTNYSHKFEIRVGGGCPPYNYKILSGSLPPGLSLNSGTGEVSGNPQAPGSYSFWVDGSDTPAACGDPVRQPAHTERQFTIEIRQGIQIVQTQSTLTPGFVNQPYSMQFTATGAATPTWSIVSGYGTGLPAGLTLNPSTGLLAGTPTAKGEFGFRVQVASGSASTVQTYSLVIVDALKIAKGPAVAEVGIPFTLTPTASGGRAGYTWSLASGTLPAGLSFDPATGTISGTPAAAGTSPLKLAVKDTLGLSVTADVNLVVVDHLALLKTRLRSAKVGAAYQVRFTVTGGVRPRTWTILGGRPGGLPKGLKLDARRGQISGTPTQAGTFRIRVQVTDRFGAHSSVGFVLKVLK